MKTIAKNTDTTWMKNEILEKIEDCHLFVLSMNSIFSMTDKPKVKEGDKISERMGYLDTELDLDVAPPFRTCWFQFAEPGHDLFSGIMDKHAGFKIYGMFLHETQPHDYLFCFVMQDANDPELHRYRFGYTTMTKKECDVWHTIALWLQPFGRSATCGTMKTSTRLAESDGVDFSHRWQVRGHWRKIAGIGKNREDEYTVSGYTFVCEHEKGPDHLPVIKKTRVVLGET